MRTEGPTDDDRVMRAVAGVRPSITEDDLSPDGWRARAIRERVLAGSTPAASSRLRRRPRPRRSRWTGALAPGLGLAVTVGIVVAVIAIVVGSNARRTPALPAAPPPALTVAPPSAESLLPPHGGMRGLLSTPQLVASASRLTAVFAQCPTCHAQLRGPATLWQSRSSDGGRTWRTERVSAGRFDLGVEAQSGDAVWATGDVGGTPKIFVSRDDGRRYSAVTSAATPAANSPLSISGGTVWALGNRCDGRRCRAVVLTGPADGDRLTATATQPALRPHVNGVQAVAEASGSTVVVTGGYAATDLQTFVSHDRGRSWTQVSYPCRRPVEGDVYPTSDQSLWAVCLATRNPRKVNAAADIIRRSTDGGRHWTTTATLAQEQPTLTPVTNHVAWITGLNGAVRRTTDGGRSWTTVLRPPTTAAGAQLAVQNAQTATVVVPASKAQGGADHRRTDLVAYHTTDGGEIWTPTVIRLPTG